MTNDMRPSYTIGRDRDGAIEAETIEGLEVGGARALFITTGKGYRGGIECVAKVKTRERGMWVYRARMLEPEGSLERDFDRKLAAEPKTRCTEKAVRAMHERAIEQVFALIEEARDFYVRKDAYDAKQKAAEEAHAAERSQEAAEALDDFNYVGSRHHY